MEQRLVACSKRYAPIQSAYCWKGKVEQQEERPLLLKTRRELVTCSPWSRRF
ncbi:divalent cation tolerance protein CutA [Roseobacter cerasinus]|uniref:divalent cation tolerance protein CutA n=1 Tax=Roseobacter cerasinus TaxID=2602289 RepID=UPI0013578E0A